MKLEIKEARLYAIVDLGYVAVEGIEAATESLINGGADVIQLRAKGYDEKEIEDFARRVQPICSTAGIPFIVNDYPAIAALVAADGVHIGQDDGSLTAVRQIVGETMIVGRSTHSPEQADTALEEGFDYIGFGPLFPTPTKKGRPGIGVDDVFYVENKVGQQIPVFCIGGITRNNIESVIAQGARRLVIVSDLLTADSIEAATAEAKASIMATPLQ